jgi:hypothetical protein
VLVVPFEHAEAVVEAAGHGRVEDAVDVVRPVNGPAAARAVEQAHGHAHPPRPPLLGRDLVDVADAAGEEARPRLAVEALPLRRAAQADLQPLVAHVPASDQEVEVVSAVHACDANGASGPPQ